MYKNKVVLVTGSGGFLGKHICTILQQRGAVVFAARSNDADLRDKKETQTLFGKVKPEVVIHCAVQGGGIGWMIEHPVASGQDNLRMNLNALEAAHHVGASSFIGVSSACVYPKYGPLPYTENAVWGGYPEPINGPYALSKRMMMDLGRAYAKEHNFHCVFPILANLYGPHDHLEPSRAHVVTDLMLRCVSSPEELIVWGTGEAQREFLYIEDAAAGVLACIKAPAGEFINIGSGSAIAILNLARLIITSHGLTIPIRLDKSKPNGQLRKVLCVKKAKELLGWHAETSLESGLKQTALWYRQQVR